MLPVRPRVREREGKGVWGNEAGISREKKVMTARRGFSFSVTTVHNSHKATAIKRSLDNRLIKTNMLGFGVTTVLNQHI